MSGRKLLLLLIAVGLALAVVAFALDAAELISIGFHRREQQKPLPAPSSPSSPSSSLWSVELPNRNRQSYRFQRRADDKLPGLSEVGAKASSQFGEDVELWNNFFYNVRDGIFVELGALDGITGSNTVMFERYFGWGGVLIEADPDSAAKLVKQRPVSNTSSSKVAVRTHHAAVCNSASVLHWASSKVPQVSGLWEFMSATFRSRFYPGRECCDGMREVMCRPFGWFLEDAGVEYFDMLSLDVEGAELSILRTVDLARFRFALIVIEMDGGDKDKESAIRELLGRHSYCRNKRIALNEIWVDCDAVIEMRFKD